MCIRDSRPAARQLAAIRARVDAHLLGGDGDGAPGERFARTSPPSASEARVFLTLVRVTSSDTTQPVGHCLLTS
eukprot:3743156-Pyramimonas_sp.AAC.2